MPGPQVDQLVTQILQALPGNGDLDAVVAKVRDGLNALMPGLAGNLAAELGEAREIVARQFEQIEILHHHSVIRRRERWYFGPRPVDVHWPSVRDFLLNARGWPEADVDGIHEASNEVVSLLESPAKTQFSCRGLVVGHVQSGKTANMTAVIAKALDAGYNAVIVLAGLTNKLRYQTQLRLFGDLVQRNPLRWQVLTPNTPDGDFRAPPQGGFLSHVNMVQLAVIKKNVSPLRELKEAIRRTLPAILAQLRILIIDDECDQASVNSARNELDMTAINRWIRELLTLLPAATYIGYTATPFANVLINPYRVDGQVLDDLYPRDFITALPRPERYFGTERLFGTTPADPSDVSPEEEGLDMIRDVPEDDEKILQPSGRKDLDTFQPKLAESLQKAILYFLSCCAVRRARGDGDKHMTMLVHTSAYISAHEKLASLIEGWIEVSRAEILNPHSAVGLALKQVWNEEQGRLPADITKAESVSLKQVLEHLPAVLTALEFPIENGASDERIDYTGPARTYIVTGGTILARGLTLEGLTVSYFLRSASQYDTLLQMGRWFGFRPGYEDLPRIWMPDDLRLRFRALAAVEQEIRDDIARYSDQNLSPMEVAVRIRAIPGMAITAATRMRAAHQCAVSYWGTHRQTFRFPRTDEGLLRANWQAAAELVSLAEALGLRDAEARDHGRKLWRRVPRASILRFLRAYVADRSHADLRPELLLPFIESDDTRLEHWNVGIVEAGRGPQSKEGLGSAGVVNMVTRARLAEGDAVADIKALMSKGDVLLDCPAGADTSGSWDDLKTGRARDVGHVPLLLLYPIDQKSGPQRQSNVRVALDASMDVLGYGIVFPGSITEGGSFVSVSLNPLSADEIEAIAAEEEDQARVANV